MECHQASVWAEVHSWHGEGTADHLSEQLEVAALRWMAEGYFYQLCQVPYSQDGIVAR
jgi:hypothetical protein